LDGLRLALIIVGIVVVVFVYLWTARRRRLDREAGVFDRFDAWTDERLDPLAPSAGDDSAGAGSDVVDNDDTDDLTQRNFRLPAVDEASGRDSRETAVADPDEAFAKPADSGQGAGAHHHGHHDSHHDSHDEPAGPVVNEKVRPAPPSDDTIDRVRAHDGTPEPASVSGVTALDGDEVIEDLEAIADSLDVRAEPHIGALDDVELGESPTAPSIRSPTPAKAFSAAQSRARPTARRPEKRDNAQGRSGVDESSADAGMVVVLNVMARGGQTFAGPSLKLALEGAGLKPGDMQLYHYRAETQADDTPPIFSALNAVKPGTLDVNAFDDMQTPGIALILRVSDLERPSESFELMLVAARRVAGELDGQVCDDTRSTLTGQALNHLRERIAAGAFHARPGC